VLATAHRAPQAVHGSASGAQNSRVKFFGMGSIVVASRTPRSAARRVPRAELHFVTFASNRAILSEPSSNRDDDHNHYVDPSTPQAFLRTTMAVAAELRARIATWCSNLEFFAKFPLVLGSLAGDPAEGGFYLTSENWRRELLDISGFYNAYFHTSDIFLSLVYLCATGDYYYLNFQEWAQRYRYPRIEPSELERMQLRSNKSRATHRQGDAIVINPNSLDLAPERPSGPRSAYASSPTSGRAGPRRPGCASSARERRPYVHSIAELCKTPRRHVLAGEISLRRAAWFCSPRRGSWCVQRTRGRLHLACLASMRQIVGLFFGGRGDPPPTPGGGGGAPPLFRPGPRFRVGLFPRVWPLFGRWAPPGPVVKPRFPPRFCFFPTRCNPQLGQMGTGFFPGPSAQSRRKPEV